MIIFKSSRYIKIKNIRQKFRKKKIYKKRRITVSEEKSRNCKIYRCWGENSARYKIVRCIDAVVKNHLDIKFYNMNVIAYIKIKIYFIWIQGQDLLLWKWLSCH